MKNRKRKVLFFTTSLGGGGAENHALRVMNHLERARYAPSLAVTKRGGNYEAFLHADVEVHSVSVGVVPSGIGRLLLGAPRLASLIRVSKPDIVCSVLDVANLCALAAVRMLRQPPKLVVCVQNPPTLRYASPLSRRAMLSGIRYAYPRADRVIALSHGVRRDLSVVVPEVADRVVVIHNACVDERIENETVDRARVVPDAARPVLLACGRLIEQKAYPDLLEALAIVRRSRDAELWVLGEGPLRPMLEALAGRLGVQGAVRFLGYNDAPHLFMRRASVFVLSSHYEGFGNVLGEALACGVPVVATDCPHGPREILTHDKTGLLTPVADPNALAAAVLRVLDDRALRDRLVKNGLERARDFHAAVIAAQYADEFDHVLGSSRASSAPSMDAEIRSPSQRSSDASGSVIAAATSVLPSFDRWPSSR